MVQIKMDISPADTTRYTYDGDENVEQAIDVHQQIIGNAIETHVPTDHFRALVLIGGYGRGEGGFCMRNGKPAPYNDYDYFVIVENLDRQSIRALMPGLRQLAHQLEQQVGVEVDFFPLSYADIPRLEFSLMFAEMRWGHRVVKGDPDVLQGMPAMPFELLRLSEFTRLMLNRGALLLLNRIALKRGKVETSGEREVFVKYLFKAVLASADAWLSANAQYHPSYPVKQERLKAMPDSEDLEILLEYYALALDARFHPDYSQYQHWHPQERLAAVEGLWKQALETLETARLGVFPDSWDLYASPLVPKGQSGDGLKPVLKNLLVNLRDFGIGSLFGNTRWSFIYPRERLISVLPLLLGEGNHVPDSVLKALALPSEADWLATADRFIELWHKYS